MMPTQRRCASLPHPEIAPALQALACEAPTMEEALRCRTVEVSATPGATVRDALARGWVEASDGPPPHVWIPTTATEIGLARETATVQGNLSNDATSIAISPKVIAMPQPMAEALGWPDADLSWNAVTKLTAAENAWADRGQDEWGPFTLSLVEDVVAEPSIDAVGHHRCPNRWRWRRSPPFYGGDVASARSATC